MNLLKKYNENKKKHLLTEVTATGATGAFVGGAGNVIDRLFAGPFHREFGGLEKQLNQQLDDYITKRMYTDDVTPLADQDFEEIDWKYYYDEEIKKDNSEYKNTTGKMQYIDKAFEKIMKDIEKNKKNEKFITKTEMDWDVDDEDKLKYVNTSSEKWKSMKSNVDYDYQANDIELGIDISKIQDKNKNEMQYIYESVEDLFKRKIRG